MCTCVEMRGGGGGAGRRTEESKGLIFLQGGGKKWIFQWMKENTTPIINKSTFKKISLSKKRDLRSEMKTQV